MTASVNMYSPRFLAFLGFFGFFGFLMMIGSVTVFPLSFNCQLAMQSFHKYCPSFLFKNS